MSNLAKRIVLVFIGLLAAVAIYTTAWDLGAGEQVFWGLPLWFGLGVIVFAAWWLPKTIIDEFRQQGPNENAGWISTLLDVVPVIIALIVFSLGWILRR